MIQANELRIGNFIEKKEITYSGLKTLTHAIEIKDLAHYESFEPILITEEWLLKFGFKKCPSFKSLYYIGTFLNIILGSEIVFEINDRPIGEIKYVHQLQNLVYALTGQELIIKQ